MSDQDIPSPSDLKKMTAQADAARAEEELSRLHKKEDEERERREGFMAQGLRDDVRERVNRALKRAAESNLTRVKAMEFSATYLADGGRAVNNADPEWPKSLQGWAARGYEFFQKELAPKGYRLHAEISEFDKSGVPKTVIVEVVWS
ncbi:MAG TPA: hypothetical protein VHA10_08020 [Hypericibacter adhaerens]|nr:hypothetical protein [Hypericibacter adhaerens]HWA43142.1 hypothetical protein [Hypericibacter adhaerens]